MAREIKFRFWDKKRKTMNMSFRIGEGLTLSETEDFVVMQCVGLEDENGKEIYEGDIVEANGMHPCVVVFNNGGFRFDGGQEAIALDFAYYSEFEIIGNIYENPELTPKW